MGKGGNFDEFKELLKKYIDKFNPLWLCELDYIRVEDFNIFTDIGLRGEGFD